jgi:hypothetical protein
MVISPTQAGVYFKPAWIPAWEAVPQLAKLQLLLICHSGLDPESNTFSMC